jgi:hypothetical protein
MLTSSHLRSPEEHAPAGGFMDHVRMKVFPPLEAAKSTIKYLQPKRSGARLYFCLSVLEQVLSPETPLYLVEGEKKSLAVAQLGLAAVGFCGIEGWHRGGSPELLEDFDAVPLKGRSVQLVPDGDAQTNLNVRRGAMRFGQALSRRGARVELVAPSTPGVRRMSKVGADDMTTNLGATAETFADLPRFDPLLRLAPDARDLGGDEA